MKTLLARYKKLFGFVGVLALTVSLAVSASAFTRSYTTSRWKSYAPQNSGSTYFLKTEYHVGTQAPWDDAYIYVEAGALPLTLREGYYYFGGYTDQFSNYNGFGSGVVGWHIGKEIDGQDTATGFCFAQTRSGRYDDDPVVNDQHLTIE